MDYNKFRNRYNVAKVFVVLSIVYLIANIGAFGSTENMAVTCFAAGTVYFGARLFTQATDKNVNDFCKLCKLTILASVLTLVFSVCYLLFLLLVNLATLDLSTSISIVSLIVAKAIICAVTTWVFYGLIKSVT